MIASGVRSSWEALAATRLLTAAALAVALVVTPVLSACAAGSAAGPPGSTSVQGRTGTDHGYIPDGRTISPFADVPAITRLKSALRAAVQRAAADARAAGIDLRISSGRRSERLQRNLLDEAVAEYGDEQKALRYVKPPGESSHVTGDAVDVLPTDADDWLERHGNACGLCRSYSNELWHFELAVAPGGTCPAPAADATQVSTP